MSRHDDRHRSPLDPSRDHGGGDRRDRDHRGRRVRLARDLPYGQCAAIGLPSDARVGFPLEPRRSILLGLEFLVADDIINTVAIEPTLRSLAVLAGIVLIRTFLSFSLEVEIDGRWPWQKGATVRPPRKD
ncbi:DUF1622 domain-containing protein [uncultured Sphingomonas sp.]|uniref:DUF1622 domain-containing protein n=1 Tax=uncultured Sphingomonas sp. TaxID=158754 RepID=UPI0035CB6C8F